MRLKAGVDLTGVSWHMFLAAVMIEPIFVAHGEQLVITAGVDGEHMDGSLHYQGLALDFRTRDMNEDDVKVVASNCQTLLHPLGYDVVMESDHIHIEYDPK